MKAVTGNDLRAGGVVYLAPDGGWTPDLARAAVFEDAAADAALSAVSPRAVAHAYLIDVVVDGETVRAAGRTVRRETIRRDGPTIKTDWRDARL
ncbi:MAG: DUF2849 domain-containing protein [Pseudomonadota bacterium]